MCRHPHIRQPNAENEAPLASQTPSCRTAEMHMCIACFDFASICTILHLFASICTCLLVTKIFFSASSHLPSRKMRHQQAMFNATNSHCRGSIPDAFSVVSLQRASVACYGIMSQQPSTDTARPVTTGRHCRCRYSFTPWDPPHSTRAGNTLHT